MQEQRVHPRFPLRCRAALRNNDQQLLYGETQDVSLGGASVLIDRNIAKGEIVSLFLQLPPQKAGEQPAVVEARARILYTAFAAERDCWRLGMQFLDFGGPPRQRLEIALQRFA